MIRFVDDFETYAVGDQYRLFLKEASIGVISSISGKKVCKGNGGAITQYFWSGEAGYGLYNYAWDVLKSYARIDPGTYSLLFELKDTISMIDLGQFYQARMLVSPAEGNKLLCWSNYYHGLAWHTNTTILNVVADGNFHDFEIRVGKNEIIFRCDTEISTHAIAPGTEAARFVTPQWKWGQNYTAYVDRHIIDSDIYGATDTSKLLIDGIGVAGIPVSLWDTTGSPPDYALTTGPTGTIDFSTVADGTYAIGGVDARGYCFHGEVDIAGGVPV